MTRTTRHIVLWALIIGLLGWFVASVSAILLPFVLGLMMAYLLDPVVDRMEGGKMQRGTATALVTATAFAILVLILTISLPLIGEQLVRLVQVLPEQLRAFYNEHIAQVRQFIYKLPQQQGEVIEQAITDVSSASADVLKNLVTTLFASSAAILNVLSLLLITPVVAFYLLRDWDGIIANIDELLPRGHANTIRAQLRKMDETMSGFLRGQMLVCSILALFYVVGLSIAGLNYSVLIGAAAGFLIIIPYVGWFAAATVGMLVAILQYDSAMMIGVIAAIFLIGQLIEGYFLTPNLVGDRVGLHPVWMIFGMLAGGVLLGFVGVLLAIPLAAIIGVLIRFAIEQYKHSELYLGEPDQPVKGAK